MQESAERRYEEDEIDLRELFKTVWDRKWFIVIFTGIVTVLAIAYALMKTPIYEVKSNMQVGFTTVSSDGNLAQKLLVEPATLVKTLNVVFNVEDKVVKKDEKFISRVTSISINKKVKNFIEIKTEGISNEEALKKNREVVEYIQNMTKAKVEQYLIDKKNAIKSVELSIKNLEEFEKVNTQREIEKLKKKSIAKIDEKIKRLHEQDIKNINRQISLIKSQDIEKIDEKIKFYKNIKIPILNKKINFYRTKLKEYTKGIEEIYRSSSSSISSTIASIQMVNYQNLILNAQNKVEDLKLEIGKIENELIVNLERERKNLLEVKIKDLQLKIDNIRNVTIVELQREKESLENDTLRKLEYQLSVTLPNKKLIFENKIENLRFKMSNQNIQNSKVIGEYVINDNPIKPKKKLIVVVAFVTGLILSIFLVFFLEFIKGFKDEDTQ